VNETLDLEPWREYLAAFDRYLKSGAQTDRDEMRRHFERNAIASGAVIEDRPGNLEIPLVVAA
jgi:hypothetical protein